MSGKELKNWISIQISMPISKTIFMDSLITSVGEGFGFMIEANQPFETKTKLATTTHARMGAGIYIGHGSGLRIILTM